MKRRLAILAGVIFAAWIAIGVYRAGLDERGPPGAPPPVTFKGGKAFGFRIKGHSWSVDYQRITTNQDQTLLDLDDVRDGIIYRDDKPYLKVRAKHMTVNMLTKDFAANGTLHIETVSHDPFRSFQTNYATWNDATQRLTLPNRSTFETGAALPLMIDSATFDVKTGDVELHHVAGGVRFK